MSKKLLLITVISLSICAANADMQSPFGANYQMNMQSAEAAAINNAVNDLSSKKDAEIDIMDVINEKPVVPTGSHKSSYYSSKDSDIPTYGVNESKTMYTDGIGRLHFFGKGNIIRE